MKNLFLFILLIPFIGCSQHQTIGVTSSDSIHWSGKTIVFIGNSVTRGRWASSDANRWTSLFTAAKGSVENNLGVDGETMQQGNTCHPSLDFSTIPTFNPSTHCVMFISLGINDVGNNNNFLNPVDFKKDYRNAVLNAISKGWSVRKIIIMNTYKPIDYTAYLGGCSVSVAATPTRASIYNAKILEVAKEFGCRFVDIYSAMNGLNSTYFDADKLHPNDNGHLFIANYLLSTL